MPSFIRRLLGQRRNRLEQFKSLSDKEYLKAYAADTDRRVAIDPQKAIGGHWEEIGALQFDFLKGQGLQPEHTLLDIGCGTLRGGRHFIRYLQPGNYSGIDVSQAALDAGRDLINEEGLSAREPRLVHVADGRLDFSMLTVSYDYLLAQSVFTHLRLSQIEECFGNLHRVMHQGSRFFFTFYRAQHEEVRGYKTFGYAPEVFVQIGERSGLEVSFPEYYHPRGQRMAEARRRLTPSG